ncbi:alginate export family protein [Novosphingobium sp. 9]|uniref:alginate export family protein n=1 Tax=Novosphingobium sp. 9 TaxID=2025349 RepID=UPI0021B5F20F|nr:alginate export family protein [Novosphingobium sp. 9]
MASGPKTQMTATCAWMALASWSAILAAPAHAETTAEADAEVANRTQVIQVAQTSNQPIRVPRSQRPVPVQIGAPPPVPVPVSPPIPEPVPGGTPAKAGIPQSLRWTEDWSNLADLAQRTSPLEALRYIPLGDDPRTYLSIGGEGRWNYTYYSSLNVGAKGKDKLSVLQQRLRLVGDLHIGPNFRAFVELGDNREFFEDTHTPPNRDKFDIMQAFVDVTIPFDATTKLTLRPGRFEMPIGNGKMVGLRDGVNVRFIYQGIRGTFVKKGLFRIDAFAVKPVTYDDGSAFDDKPEKGRHFNGIYAASVPGLIIPDLAVDLYWYDLYRQNARYATLTGTESRRTWGLRLSGRSNGFDYDGEWAYQNGSFAGEKIEAWGMLLEGGYSLKNAPLAPRFGGRINYFSGDSNPNDGKIGTFAPPFPRTPLYTDSGWFNFSNLFDVFPSVTLKPTKKLSIVTGPDFLWRATKNDAVYAGPTNFPLIRPIGNRYVGTDLNFQVDYLATKNLSFHLYYTHFMASDAFQAGGGRSSDYFGFWTDVRF